LPARVSFDSCFIIQHILPEINSELVKAQPEQRRKALDLHMYIASA
jgi:hypothetical protein